MIQDSRIKPIKEFTDLNAWQEHKLKIKNEKRQRKI